MESQCGIVVGIILPRVRFRLRFYRAMDDFSLIYLTSIVSRRRMYTDVHRTGAGNAWL